MAQVGSPDTSTRSLPPTTAEGSEAFNEAIKALETYKKKDSSKVIVRFKAVGNAPIMKQNFYKITSSNRFQAVIQFLRKELGWQAGEPLFTYINLAFSPAPDDTVSNLFKSFSTDGHLIVNYSTTAAWGLLILEEGAHGMYASPDPDVTFGAAAILPIHIAFQKLTTPANQCIAQALQGLPSF